MDASEIYSKRLNAKGVIFCQRKRGIYFSSRRWTNQTSRRRSGTENTHLDTGVPNSRRKVEGGFLENQKGLFLHHLKTHFGIPV